MAPQTQSAEREPALTPRQSMNAVVRLLMTMRGFDSRSQLAKVMTPALSQTALYGKLTPAPTGPEFTASEIAHLANVLDVPVGVLFGQPSLEDVADGLGMTALELAEQVARGVQKRKKLMGPDLRIIQGSRTADSLTDAGGPRRDGAGTHLRIVHSTAT